MKFALARFRLQANRLGERVGLRRRLHLCHAGKGISQLLAGKIVVGIELQRLSKAGESRQAVAGGHGLVAGLHIFEHQPLPGDFTRRQVFEVVWRELGRRLEVSESLARP